MFEVFERGQELKGLRTFGIGITGWWGNQSIPCVAVFSPSTPDLRSLATAVTQTTGVPGISPVPVSSATGFSPVLLKPQEAPGKWIDYTMFDLVVISIADLGQLSDSARESLASWMLSGGNLLVYGLGEVRENSQELNRLLDLDNRVPRGATWRKPLLADRSVVQQLVDRPAGKVAPPGDGGKKATVSGDQLASPQNTTKSNPASNLDAPFVIRRFGWGQLVASSQADPFPGVLEDWGWVIKTLSMHRLQWHTRHGMTPRGDNDDFWGFLIPGVGRSPVGGFQILITLFALVIGPVNYFLLSRRKQLHLLLVTVPVLAIGTTLLLVGYATIADGFELRVRTRGVTMLDQVRGESVSWSRLSYYAGLAPSGGMRFSSDTAVYPLHAPGSRAERRTVDWTDGQRFPIGWLRSRTPTQLLAIAYRQTPEHLAVAIGNTGTVRVTNNLESGIKRLFLCDGQGQIHSAGELGRGESVRLEPSDLVHLQAEIRALIGGQPLNAPAEITNRSTASYGFLISSRRMFWGGAASSEWSNSLLEKLLEDLQSTDTERVRAVLGPRTYIAVTEQPAMVELGVSGSKDEGSLFIVVGMF